MSRLKVRLRGAIVSEFPLEEGHEYLAGRKEDCDIRLQPEKGISREHFKLSHTDGSWQVSLVARFGDLITQGTKVDNVVLQNGTSFSVPPYEFEFLDSQAVASRAAVSEAPVTSSENADMPIADFLSRPDIQLPPPSPVEVKSDTNLTSEKTLVGVAPSVPYIKVIGKDGHPREMLRLEGGNTWLAGRDSSCNIIIRDPRVSRRQFELRKQNGLYYIVDLGSVNGTLVNGSPISSNEPQAIKSGDAITVLDNQYYFELHDPGFKHRLESAYIPPPPPPEALVNPSANEDLFNFEQMKISSSPSGSEPAPIPLAADEGASPQEIPEVPLEFNPEAPVANELAPPPLIEEIPAPAHAPSSAAAYVQAPPMQSGYVGAQAAPQMYMPPMPQASMPGYQYNPYQQQAYQSQAGGNFYSPPPGGVPPYGMQMPEAAAPDQKKKMIRLVLMTFVLALFGFIGYQEFLAPPPLSRAPSNAPVGGLTPNDFQTPSGFDHLSEADKGQVLEFYKQAENLCSQEKWHECKLRIESLHAILPDGYKDSKRYLGNALGFIEAEEYQRKEEERLKAEAEEKEFIEGIVNKCRRLVNPKVTLVEIENCLTEADQRNPLNPSIGALKTEVSNIESDRKLQEEEKERELERVRELRKLFAEAEEVHRSGYALKTIAAYKKVIQRKDLPDPGKLRKKSEERIAAIEEKIQSKTHERIDEAEKFYKEGQIREAILALREALLYDPENKEIKVKIDIYISDLTVQLRQVYTEAMLEEHFGNIDGSEGRPGAISKLEEIVRRDVKDGEYYRKAMSKLVNLQKRRPSAY